MSGIYQVYTMIITFQGFPDGCDIVYHIIRYRMFPVYDIVIRYHLRHRLKIIDIDPVKSISSNLYRYRIIIFGIDKIKSISNLNSRYRIITPDIMQNHG